MPGPLTGLRVLDIATIIAGPSAAALLADWGADVVKVEHPLRGDPLRGLRIPTLAAGKDPSALVMEQCNRSKRSIALDLEHPDSRPVLERLLARSDVFMTNLRPEPRQRLRLDVADVRSVKADLICATGSAMGSLGPDRDRGGYEHATFWARGGLADTFHHPALPYPPRMPGGMGDLTAGAMLAGAIAAGVAGLRLHGEPSTIDVSMLGLAAWMNSSDLQSVSAGMGTASKQFVLGDRSKAWNPLMGMYRTADDRFIALNIVQSDRFWSELCDLIDGSELATDERFDSAAARAANATELVTLLDEIFARHPLADWMHRLGGARFVWEPVQTVDDLVNDPQVVANGILVPTGDESSARVVSGPAQFDATPPAASRAPEHGEHTEEILLEMGFGWDDIGQLQEAGAIN
jgi:crotonobetainyl-CoA:carnitine CoA-transferase CaiB-like acyl-CoA transferase